MSALTHLAIDAHGAIVPHHWPDDQAPAIGLQLLTLLQAHPDAHVPAESLAFLRRRQEDLEDALDLYETRMKRLAQTGRAPGLDPDHDDPPELRAMRALERVLQATWNAVNAVWPGENTAHAEIRGRLLGPIVEALTPQPPLP